MPGISDAEAPVGRRRRVTISQLAEHLGLTKGTVSRALNDYPDIAEGTRLRVRNAAERLGYRPLSHAQAIRTGRIRSIGLVLQVSEYDGHRPFLEDFLAGLSASASQADWTMTVATARSEEDAERIMLKLADDGKADGFILPRTREQDRRVEILRAAGVPFVLFGRTGDLTGCPYYDIEGEAAMQDAVGRLAALGHERIGFIEGGTEYTYTRLRRGGYLDGLAKAGLAADPDLIAGPAIDNASGADCAARLLDLPNPPTAILCSVDRAAIGAYETARERGLKIGSDLSLIAYDGIPEGALMDPPLSTYSVDMQAAGERLAAILIDRIRDRSAGIARELAQPSFLDRGSHGPRSNPPYAAKAGANSMSSKGGSR